MYINASGHACCSFNKKQKAALMGSLDSPQLKKRRLSDDGHDSPAPIPQLLVKKLSDKARIPTRGSLLAAGYDLYR
ncbi:hypothetical protein AZE42_10425 [Rhizopogon vesiculosus]|uniref:Uncharacterized protein n=1 Tax=Rhizopogon vesiculosus TaxID=180088 RepID=A0A1J8PWG4_9AGAM|nr:hypothetical protein AZE42_10425 [Rhizopogon vesiculosus]